MGNHVRTDPNSFKGGWREYLHIRVSVDITQPLKKKMRIKGAGGEWNCIHFQFERLPYFYFFYGVIGHSNKFCSSKFEAGPDK